MSPLTSIIVTIATGLIRVLLGRWLEKDPEKERLKHALKAKKKEVDIMSAPPRDESVVDDLLRDRAKRRESDRP